MSDYATLYSAVYSSKDEALADLDAFQQLHDDEVIGKYDAAVVDKENGKPHIVKRVDRPRINVIPELVGGGELKRSELNQVADELAPGEAALVVVGEPTIEKAFQKAVKDADKTAKQEFDQSADDLADALLQASKS
ncbi:MAG TPA: hypothetical protein VMT74_08805 [Gaiellaceae bacterium]|nr:hypothetical protein [Gaiellaceae bacterium]